MSNSKLETVGLVAIATPFIAVFMMLAGAYGVFANGYVLAHIWAWYAVPLGAPVVSWLTFAGVMMAKSIVLGLPTAGDSDKKDGTGAAAIGKLFVIVAYPWFVLLLAWWLKS
jgi:hypothetical protein